MSAKFYVTPTITTLCIYLYFCSFWHQISCAKLDFEQLVRRNRRDNDRKHINLYNVMELLKKEGLDTGSAQQMLGEKRKIGVDLGLNRGYSGMKEAKHLIGLALATRHNNPGKRRRRRSPVSQ